MRAPRWAAVTAALVGAVALVPAAPAAAEPALSATGVRVEPGIVEFFLSATELTGGRLDQAAVTVTAGDTTLPATAQLLSATEGRAPRRVTVLALDASGSMAGAPLAAARAAAAGYAATLPADVRVGLVAISTAARTVLAPTADRAALAAALDGVTAAGDTALYDGVLAAVEAARAEEYAQRRVVVLSDGADTTSKTTLDRLYEVLGPSGTAVDTVGFRTGEDTAEVLARLSERTSGRFFTVAQAGGLAAAFREAAGAFAVQLVVTAQVPPALAGKASRMEIAAQVGDERLRTDLPVTFAVDPAAAAPLADALSRMPWSALQIGVLVLVFAALLLFGLVAFAPMLDVARHRRRLSQVERFAAPRAAVAARSPAGVAGVAGVAAEDARSVARTALALSEQVVRGGGLESRLALQLDRAGMRLRPHEWLLLRAVIAFATAFLLALWVGPLAGLPLGLLLGYVGTALYWRRRADSRVRSFATLLPDALQLVTGSLRSGFSLSQSIDAMCRELPAPVSTEFGRALGETRLGVELEDALSRLAARMRSTDLAWAVVAMRIQREVGGNLAEVLSTVVDTMRERDAVRRHVRALSAEGRLSAWVLLALPIVMALFMFTFRRSYLEPLYTTAVGWAMLLGATLLVAVGGFWMSRVVKVEL